MDKFLVISNIVVWIVLLVQTVLIFFLAKFVTDFLNRFRIKGGQAEKITMTIGEKAPLFRELNQHRDIVRLAESEKKMTLMLFTNESCNICKEIVPNLEGLVDRLNLRVIVVSKTEVQNYTPYYGGLVHFIVAETIFENYKVQGVPSMYLIDGPGTIVGMESPSSFHHLNVYLEHFFRQAG